MKRLLLVLAVALAVGAAPAEATKRCQNVKTTSKAGETIRAQVKVQRGKTSCTEARRVAIAILSGKARYHEGDSSATSYYIVSGGWRGGISTGAWAATNKKTNAYIIGQILSA